MSIMPRKISSFSSLCVLQGIPPILQIPFRAKRSRDIPEMTEILAIQQIFLSKAKKKTPPQTVCEESSHL